jgi:hypothetical protein
MSSFTVYDNNDNNRNNYVMVDTKLPFTKGAIAEYIKNLDAVVAQDIYDNIDRLRKVLEELKHLNNVIREVLANEQR